MRTLVAICVAALGAASAAQGAEPGFYVGVGLGQAEQDVAPSDGVTIIIIDGPFGGGGIATIPPDRVELDGKDLSRVAVLGYRINRYVAAELSYLHFGEATVTEYYRLDPPPSPFFPDELVTEYTSEVSGPAMSVLGMLPIGSQWHVFLRGGVLFADQQTQMETEQNTFGKELWLGGAGVDWGFTSRWSVRAEYQRTGKLDSTFVSGETDIEHWSLGVLFRFGAGPAPQ